jgi:hypothetical protein
MKRNLQKLKSCNIATVVLMNKFDPKPFFHSSSVNNYEQYQKTESPYYNFNKIFEKEYIHLLDTKLKMVQANKSLMNIPLFDDKFVIDLKKNIHNIYQKNKYYGWKQEDHEIVRQGINQKIDDIMERKIEDFSKPDDRIKLLWLLPYLCISSYLSDFIFESIISVAQQIVGDPSANFAIALTFTITPVGGVAACISLGIGFGIPIYITRKIVNTTKWDYFNAIYLKRK